MRYGILFCFVAVLAAKSVCAVEVGASLGELKTVPAMYVDEEACPFECCRYGAWTARASMTLFSAPRGDKVVGKVAVGDEVEGLTGNVYVRPIKATVLLSKTDDVGNTFTKGETFFVMARAAKAVFLRGPTAIFSKRPCGWIRPMRTARGPMTPAQKIRWSIAGSKPPEN
jgi:hypothetical protein